jgi:hypothetical protein
MNGIFLCKSSHTSINFFLLKIVGSSILFIHDEFKSGIHLIDFGKIRELPKHMQITHTDMWVEGNHEDGYIIGIASPIKIIN